MMASTIFSAILVNRCKIMYNTFCSVSRQLSVCVVSQDYHSMLGTVGSSVERYTRMLLDSLSNIVAHKDFEYKPKNNLLPTKIGWRIVFLLPKDVSFFPDAHSTSFPAANPISETVKKNKEISHISLLYYSFFQNHLF